MSGLAWVCVVLAGVWILVLAVFVWFLWRSWGGSR